MKDFYKSAVAIVESLESDIFPSIENLLSDESISWTINDAIILENELAELISALREELLSLINYEQKLVFPAILNFMKTSAYSILSPTVDIEGITRLTGKKEKRIADLRMATQKAFGKDVSVPEAFSSLTKLLDNEYDSLKNQWYELIKQWQMAPHPWARKDHSTSDKIMPE